MTTTSDYDFEAQFFTVDEWCGCAGTDGTLPVMVVWVVGGTSRTMMLAHRVGNAWAYCPRTDGDPDEELHVPEKAAVGDREAAARNEAAVEWLNGQDVDWRAEWREAREQVRDEAAEAVEHLRAELEESERQLRVHECAHAVATLDPEHVPAAVRLLDGGWHGSADDLTAAARTITT